MARHKLFLQLRQKVTSNRFEHETKTKTKNNAKYGTYGDLAENRSSALAEADGCGARTERIERRGAINPVATETTAMLLHRLAASFLCSLCTRFDIGFSIMF